MVQNIPCNMYYRWPTIYKKEVVHRLHSNSHMIHCKGTECLQFLLGTLKPSTPLQWEMTAYLGIWKAGNWVAHPCGTHCMKHYSREAYRCWLALGVAWQFFLSCKLNPSVCIELRKSGWQKEKYNDTYFIRTCTKGFMDLFLYLVIFWSTIWNTFCLLTSIHTLEKLMLLKVMWMKSNKEWCGLNLNNMKHVPDYIVTHIKQMGTHFILLQGIIGV